MNNKIKIGILGSGGYGRTARKYLNNSSCYKITACMDVDKSAAEKAAEEEGAEAFTELDSFFTSDMQAVCINTPVFLHAEHTRACLEAGKHVFITKPVTPFSDQAEKLKVQAVEKKLAYMVGHHARFSPDILLAKSLIESGKLGRLCNISVTCCSSGGLSACEENDWRMKKGENPGGPLLQCGIHSLDSLISIFGAPDKVISMAQSDITPPEVMDNLITLIEFKSGVQVSFIANYTTAYYHSYDFFGTEANLHLRHHVSGLGQTEAYLQKRGTGEHEPWLAQCVTKKHPDPDEHGGVLEKEFARQIRGSSFDYTNLDQSIQAVKIVHAAVESIETGKKVNL
ncbi:MAG: Gfo/Idh/MocA family protein [Planctomycetota bacterium]|jgi:predicted dehydrogenase